MERENAENDICMLRFGCPAAVLWETKLQAHLEQEEVAGLNLEEELQSILDAPLMDNLVDIMNVFLLCFMDGTKGW